MVVCWLFFGQHPAFYSFYSSLLNDVLYSLNRISLLKVCANNRQTIIDLQSLGTSLEFTWTVRLVSWILSIGNKTKY